MPDQLQRLIGVALSIATLPIVAALVVLIRVDSRGPALYRAVRVGARGQPFICYKLRTMTSSADDHESSAVTVNNDDRITRVGRYLRSKRLDELPQLWNVVRGEMRLVGPRPETPRFVDWRLPAHRVVFTEKPGITGLTQLHSLDESAALTGADPERTYRELVLPAKLRIDLAYLRRRSTKLDVWILRETVRALLRGNKFPIDHL